MTLLESAKKGIAADALIAVSQKENIPVKELVKLVAAGHAAVVKSNLHACPPAGVGKGLSVKINANIGTSCVNCDMEGEFAKMEAAIKYGADAIMDLSTGGDISRIRKEIIKRSAVPVGTVPIYEVISTQPDVSKITEDDFLHGIHAHIQDGVDFITVHTGLTREAVGYLSPRIMGVVSRGGSFIAKWMLYHNKENPFLTRFDDICEMAAKEEVVLSLGDGLRPGCLHDATDRAQITELKMLGKLARRAYKKNVQVIIEGPGHVPLQQVKQNIDLQKKYCNGAPFYVLGPLVTDISPGYDHISGAIGGALAAMYGADFLCYLTPREHLALPDLDDVIEGVVASKIAAHAADIARGLKGARDRDDAMAKARSALDWEKMFALSLNPDKARRLKGADTETGCSMCGNLCSVKANAECRSFMEGKN